VSLLPNTLTDEQKFQIARRVVIAEQQYVTYNEFLPSMGVSMPQYTGYNPNVNTTFCSGTTSTYSPADWNWPTTSTR